MCCGRGAGRQPASLLLDLQLDSWVWVLLGALPQEEAYQRMSALKKAQWEKNNSFYSNRSFSRDIRKVGAGQSSWNFCCFQCIWTI